jgi:MoxR-like ATPase
MQPTLTPIQLATLASAKAWWYEGERSLDYLAEKARHEAYFAQAVPLLQKLRLSSESEGLPTLLRSLLRLARAITGNRAINRTLETPAFATALQALLYSELSLPERIEAFLQKQRVGRLITAHLLHLAFPDRYPLLHPRTIAIWKPTRLQRQTAREAVCTEFSLTADTVSRDTLSLLTEFHLYDVVRKALALSDFAELHGILIHAPEMPQPVRRGKRTRATNTAQTVQEERSRYGMEAHPAVEWNEEAVLRYVEGYIAAQGFTFPPLLVRNYYIALKAKPFVLLTGLSGTGKTRLTRLFAEAITGGVGQYLPLPVRPDWTDSTPLLGYHNLLTDRYVTPAFLRLLQEAGLVENRERTYFLCLDEMNLARTEHYFAEILSAMETPDRRIPLQEGRTVTLPENVFLAGSVNMDEATHTFSRKVLDRANTIEFTEVRLESLAMGGRTAIALPDISATERQRLFLQGRITTVDRATERLSTFCATYPEQVLTLLTALNDKLTPRGLHFGYRVRDEIFRYVAASFATDGTGLLVAEGDSNLQTALDLQIVQKVLPRLSGTHDSLDRLLRDLEAWAGTHHLPRTSAKLTRIHTRAAEDGIVSFYDL